MNKRHNIADGRANKQSQKEVHKAMGKGDTSWNIPNKSASKDNSCGCNSAQHDKKCSKRTSTHAGIENSPPAYPHKEGGKWIENTQRQTNEKNQRMQNKHYQPSKLDSKPQK